MEYAILPQQRITQRQTEDSVKPFKFGIRKLFDDPVNKGRDIDEVIEKCSYINRNTQHAESGESPYRLEVQNWGESDFIK